MCTNPPKNGHKNARPLDFWPGDWYNMVAFVPVGSGR